MKFQPSERPRSVRGDNNRQGYKYAHEKNIAFGSFIIVEKNENKKNTFSEIAIKIFGSGGKKWVGR